MSHSVSESLALRMVAVGSDEELLARLRKYLFDSPYLQDTTRVMLCRAAILKRDAEKEQDAVR